MDPSILESSDKCINVSGERWCYDPAPKDARKCVNIKGYFICKADTNERTFSQEKQRFKDILFYPKLRTDEAKKTEMLIIEFTIGFILSALVFTLSFYIKDVIDLIVLYVFPVGFGLLSILIIVTIMVVISILLAIIQSRLMKASEETNVLEKLAEKTPIEMLNTLFGD